MSDKIRKLLKGENGNYILPFFWQHGEDEATLRKYMDVIHKSNIGAVCVESRPHPDYCGPKWWADMDVILDEARKGGMKVWILDDSHFPTGFANGAMDSQPDSLRRQSITFRRIPVKAGETLQLSAEELNNAGPYVQNELEKRFSQGNKAETKVFTDDRLLGISAVRTDVPEADGCGQERVDLAPFITEDGISWTPEEGSWKVYVLNLTRNRGPHRNYINMMDRKSVRVLIDAVYEPHWQHYADDFGKTIAGFFSDEPELGNGHLYEKDCQLGCYDDEDYPWSAELEDMLKEKLSGDWNALALLWDNEADATEKARVRYIYMDCVTRLVEECFSWQLGGWCREHGVKYIGHLIEDNNQHARTGSSLGHYFRGLAGEDWSGIDDIGGQVMPQGEDLKLPGFFSARDGEFYHYMLGKLASSAAAIEPLKKGNSMCEVFGAYGWSEGVRLEKYLIDHLMVRGVNHYVPHAFSPKAFPDPDCPPHFYAHGHNPQYRHFGALMAYANRVCELISDGKHAAPAAILYHGEAEWMGKTTFGHRAGRILADSQIEYDYIPADVFEEPEKFGTRCENGKLFINGYEYRLFIVPEMEFITEAAAKGIRQMQEAGVAVVCADAAPKGIGNADDPGLWHSVKELPVVPLAGLPACAEKAGAKEVRIAPENNRIRYIRYFHEDGSTVYMFVNEGTETWKGTVELPETAGKAAAEGIRSIYHYDAWTNSVYAADIRDGLLHTAIQPLHSCILVIDRSEAVQAGPKPADPFLDPECFEGLAFADGWKRSTCVSLDYPAFGAAAEVTLPDHLEEEQPLFSGIVRYENTVVLSGSMSGDDAAGTEAVHTRYVLVIEDASEGVEVFVNEKSLGIQVAPPFAYDLTGLLCEGENPIAIEVATTLERETSEIAPMFGMKITPTSKSGITGTVKLWKQKV